MFIFITIDEIYISNYPFELQIFKHHSQLCTTSIMIKRGRILIHKTYLCILVYINFQKQASIKCHSIIIDSSMEIS